MPIYEYACRECGHKFEKFQQISAEPVKHCPECGKDAAERLISLNAFHLKGGGWFSQGYSAGGESKPSGGTPAAPSTGNSSES